MPPATPPAATPATPETTPAPQAGLWRLPIGVAAIGLGLVGMGIGFELRNQAKTSFDESNLGHCNAEDLCDQTGVDLRSDAVAKGNGATAAAVLGTLFAVGGVVLILTDLPGLKARVSSPKSASSAPRLAITGNGLLLKGSF